MVLDRAQLKQAQSAQREQADTVNAILKELKHVCEDTCEEVHTLPPCDVAGWIEKADAMLRAEDVAEGY